MESSSNSASSNMRSTSLFLPISHNIDDELDVNDLLSYCDANSPPRTEAASREPQPAAMHHNLLNSNYNTNTHPGWPSPSHQFSPNPQFLQFSPPPVSSNLPSYNHFSPNFSSDHGFISSPPPTMAGFSKRDWISSLPRSSSSFSLSAPAPTCVPSSAPSPLGHQHRSVAPSHPSQFACDKPGLRLSSSTNNLQSCKPTPSSSQLRYTPQHINPGLSLTTNRVQVMQAEEQGQDGCNRIHDGDDDSQPAKPQGSTGGTNAYTGAVLRLSDVIAAMRTKSPNSAAMEAKSSHSHLSSSAFNSSNSPILAFNSSNSQTSSPNLAFNTPKAQTSSANLHNGVNRAINPTMVQSGDAKTLVNTDKLLHISPSNARCESKKSKKIGKSNSVSSLAKVDVLMSGVMENTRKDAQDFGSMGEPANKREVHIYSERERRRGMAHLYATLHSLLPNGKIKADRCSVLTETMDYIQTLLDKLEELGKQKVEVLASMQEDAQTDINKPAASTASTESRDKGTNPSTCGDTHAAKSSKIGKNRELEEIESAKHADNGARSRAFDANHGRAEKKNLANEARTGANASTRKGVKGHGNAGINEKRAEMSMSDKSVKSREPSMRALDGEYGSSEANSKDENLGVDMCENESGDESVAGSQEARGEVGVRLFGEDAFITVRTLKKRGAWSGVLEVLQQVGIHILNVTLSATPDSDHHCIHGKVPSGCKINSCALKRSLKALVGAAQKA